jgi:hypothetical protein
MSRVYRVDRGAPPLAPARPLPSGGMEVEGRAMRAGVLDYVKDGRPWREVRPPEENARAIPSLIAAPVTDGHPAEMITARNARKYSVGTVLDARPEGDWAVVRLALHDEGVIEHAGRAGYLSAGYNCDQCPPDPELEKIYGPHDAVQRHIVVNHLARVDAARAGDDARVRLDAAGHEITETKEGIEVSTEKKKKATDERREQNDAADAATREAREQARLYQRAIELMGKLGVTKFDDLPQDPNAYIPLVLEAEHKARLDSAENAHERYLQRQRDAFIPSLTIPQDRLAKIREDLARANAAELASAAKRKG